MTKVLVAGSTRGTVLKTGMPINFLGTVDKETGTIGDPNHELYAKSVKGTILVFPSGIGSSVGAYTIYSLSQAGAAPRAMVCTKADMTVTSGCAVAGIPLIIIPEAEFAALKDGADISLDTARTPALSTSF